MVKNIKKQNIFLRFYNSKYFTVDARLLIAGLFVLLMTLLYFAFFYVEEIDISAP